MPKMTYMPVPEKYIPMVAKIAENLGLPETAYKISFVKNIAGSNGMAYGDGRIVMVDGREFWATVTTLAHEMRHVWQTYNGIHTQTYVAPEYDRESLYYDNKRAKWEHNWTGTFFAAKAMKVSRKKYYARPWEIDARCYAASWVNYVRDGTPMPDGSVQPSRILVAATRGVKLFKVINPDWA